MPWRTMLRRMQHDPAYMPRVSFVLDNPPAQAAMSSRRRISQFAFEGST